MGNAGVEMWDGYKDGYTPNLHPAGVDSTSKEGDSTYVSEVEASVAGTS